MWLQARQALVGLVAAAVIGTGPGCGGGGGSPASPTSAAPPAAPASGDPSLQALDGDWRGTSAQGGAIAFSVRNGRVVSLTTEWSGQGGSCARTTSAHAMNVEIFTGGSVLGRFSHTQGDLAFFQGTFNSPSAASGSFHELLQLSSGATCDSGSVTWTASR